ncbi:MAG: Fur family transcriptional regulator [Gemmatimonadales bacterium]
MTNPPPSVDGDALLEIFRRYLRDHNLPVTHQRVAIAEAVFFAKSHLSVGDLEALLSSGAIRIGRATIYRTLELMLEAGLIREHDFDEGFKRYEAVTAKGHHEHLICMDCGRVVEFSSERLERMKVLIAEEYGFRHHHHRLEIYGVCRECQGKDARLLRIGAIRDEETGRD